VTNPHDASTPQDTTPTDDQATPDAAEQSSPAVDEAGEDFAPESAGNPPQSDVIDVGGEDEEHLPPGQTAVPVGDEVVIDDETMRRALEAILMVTDEPLPVLTLARAVGRPTGDVAAALAELSAEYTEQGRGFDLREIGGGWRYYTRVEAAPYVERFVLDGQQARLTQAALETLAVVAYKQPVSRARVSAIRGVNVDGVMRTLVARGLVEEAGSDTESQATLYRTTSYFLERMGMQSLDDLPELAPYLPEMDDIEDELAAQTLPPAEPPTEPGTSSEETPAEGADGAVDAAGQHAEGEADGAGSVTADDERDAEASASSGVAAEADTPAVDGEGDEYAGAGGEADADDPEAHPPAGAEGFAGTDDAEVGEETAAPGADGTSAVDAEDTGAEDPDAVDELDADELDADELDADELNDDPAAGDSRVDDVEAGYVHAGDADSGDRSGVDGGVRDGG
jgi:segregation and condensation protein B